MKQPVDLSQGHRSNCLAGEHNLRSLRIWLLIKVTFERCPSVLHWSCQAGLGSHKHWPLCDHPPHTLHEHTLCSDAAVNNTHIAPVSINFPVNHEALLPLQSSRPVARALCMLTAHRWTSWRQNPLTSLSNLYKIKLKARRGIYATMCMELAWRRKLTK